MSEPARFGRAPVNKIFGDSLPETTKDEWDEHHRDSDAERDRWLRENVPPHHG